LRRAGMLGAGYMRHAYGRRIPQDVWEASAERHA
jgi:hypothetical protein